MKDVMIRWIAWIKNVGYVVSTDDQSENPDYIKFIEYSAYEELQKQLIGLSTVETNFVHVQMARYRETVIMDQLAQALRIEMNQYNARRDSIEALRAYKEYMETLK